MKRDALHALLSTAEGVVMHENPVLVGDRQLPIYLSALPFPQEGSRLKQELLRWSELLATFDW